MPKRKEPELTQKEQSKRFKETAKSLSADETGDAFNRAVKGLLEPKVPKPEANHPRRVVKPSSA